MNDVSLRSKFALVLLASGVGLAPAARADSDPCSNQLLSLHAVLLYRARLAIQKMDRDGRSHPVVYAGRVSELEAEKAIRALFDRALTGDSAAQAVWIDFLSSLRTEEASLDQKMIGSLGLQSLRTMLGGKLWGVEGIALLETLAQRVLDAPVQKEFAEALLMLYGVPEALLRADASFGHRLSKPEAPGSFVYAEFLAMMTYHPSSVARRWATFGMGAFFRARDFVHPRLIEIANTDARSLFEDRDDSIDRSLRSLGALSASFRMPAERVHKWIKAIRPHWAWESSRLSERAFKERALLSAQKAVAAASEILFWWAMGHLDGTVLRSNAFQIDQSILPVFNLGYGADTSGDGVFQIRLNHDKRHRTPEVQSISGTTSGFLLPLYQDSLRWTRDWWFLIDLPEPELSEILRRESAPGKTERPPTDEVVATFKPVVHQARDYAAYLKYAVLHWPASRAFVKALKAQALREFEGTDARTQEKLRVFYDSTNDRNWLEIFDWIVGLRRNKEHAVAFELESTDTLGVFARTTRELAALRWLGWMESPGSAVEPGAVSAVARSWLPKRWPRDASEILSLVARELPQAALPGDQAQTVRDDPNAKLGERWLRRKLFALLDLLESVYGPHQAKAVFADWMAESPDEAVQDAFYEWLNRKNR